jgi:NAD(P)-dependent dehydrogenase (short-subunit alcohol dehydrogenase family)
MQELTGRVAVVTGAASGIGAGLARAFAEIGMKIVAADIELEPAQKLADALRGAGGEAIAVRTDVSQPADLEALAERAWDAFGGVHVLCNNAGVCQGGPIWEMTSEDWRWLLSVNFGGVINGCRAFVPRLLAEGGPAHIVNTASVGGFLTGGELGMYGTTKFAVVGYSESLAQELEPHDIGVSILCPGWTHTRLGGAARNRPADLGEAPAKMDLILPGMAAGMDPLEVGRRTLRGIRENALYVFTHPEFKPIFELRFAKVLEALDRGTEPPGEPGER